MRLLKAGVLRLIHSNDISSQICSARLMNDRWPIHFRLKSIKLILSGYLEKLSDSWITLIVSNDPLIKTKLRP